MASSDDEELKAAIALSLADQGSPPSPELGSSAAAANVSPPSGKKPVVIDLSNDTDESDDELRPVMRVDQVVGAKSQSRSEASATASKAEEAALDPCPRGDQEDRKDGTTLLQNLDRKTMEQDRLARLKRKAPVSPPRLRRNKQLSSHLQGERRPALANGTTPTQKLDPQGIKSSSGVSPPVQQASASSGLQFPRGVVRKTWAFGYERNDDIKFEEVLQKNDLTVAVLSAFQWDVEWLMRKVDLSKTKMVFVMQAKDEATKTQYRNEVADMASLRLCFPSMDGAINCMHSKLQLLFHPTHLRVVVPSANLVPHDWGENGGVMENTVFLIDLPRLNDASQPPEKARENLTFFGTELVYFLEASGIERDVIDGVLRFDFSVTKGIAFVHTIGGPHTGDSWRRTGYCGLGRAVRHLGLQHNGVLDIDFVSSSIGSLNDAFLKAIYLAAQGDDGLTEYNLRVAARPQTRRRGAPALPQAMEALDTELSTQILNHFRIYFPTRDTVLGSRGGDGAGGTICLHSKWYDAPTFPRNLFRDCVSSRTGLLMHNKLLYARPRPLSAAVDGGHAPAWAYVGSANLSESAWGRLVEDQKTKQPRLSCRNWECGVLIPTSSHRLPGTSEAATAATAIESFDGHVPIPMRFPGSAYGSRRPWLIGLSSSNNNKERWRSQPR